MRRPRLLSRSCKARTSRVATSVWTTLAVVPTTAAVAVVVVASEVAVVAVAAAVVASETVVVVAASVVVAAAVVAAVVALATVVAVAVDAVEAVDSRVRRSRSREPMHLLLKRTPRLVAGSRRVSQARSRSRRPLVRRPAALDGSEGSCGISVGFVGCRL